MSIVELYTGLAWWYPSPWSSFLYREFDTTEDCAVEPSSKLLCELGGEVNVAVRFIGKGFEGVVADWWGIVGCVGEEGLREECGEESGVEGSNVQADSVVEVSGRAGNRFGGGRFGGVRLAGLDWCGFCLSASGGAWGGHWHSSPVAVVAVQAFSFVNCHIVRRWSHEQRHWWWWWWWWWW